MVDIIDRFMTGMEETIPDEKERYRVIVEECLYFSDINPTNIFLCKLLVDPYNEYKLKYNEGDTLKLDVKEKWGVEGFDAVIGNPPYNNELWSQFVKKSLIDLCQNGFLLYVHPANWRKPNHKIGRIMLTYDILYLNIYDIKTTSALFRCNVRVDWYLLQKSVTTALLTTIYDERKQVYSVNLKDVDFIPNSNIDMIYKIINLSIPSLHIVRRHTILSNSKHLRMSPDNEYKYPVITNLNSKEKRIKYMNHPHEDHSKKKVIMSYALNLYPFFDNGNMSPTEHVFYQVVDSEEEGLKLVRYLDSDIFQEILQSCKWIGYQTDHNIFRYLPDVSKQFQTIDTSEAEIMRLLCLNKTQSKKMI